jgi:hypothetical protein
MDGWVGSVHVQNVVKTRKISLAGMKLWINQLLA